MNNKRSATLYKYHYLSYEVLNRVLLTLISLGISCYISFTHVDAYLDIFIRIEPASDIYANTPLTIKAIANDGLLVRFYANDGFIGECIIEGDECSVNYYAQNATIRADVYDTNQLLTTIYRQISARALDDYNYLKQEYAIHSHTEHIEYDYDNCNDNGCYYYHANYHYHYDSNGFNYKLCYDYYYRYWFYNIHNNGLYYGDGDGYACYWYVRVYANTQLTQLYDNGFPTSNDDLSLYKNDNLLYNATIVMASIDINNPSHFTNVSYDLPYGVDLIPYDPYLYDLPLRGIVINEEYEEGYHALTMSVYYETPYYTHSRSYDCSNIAENCSNKYYDDSGYIERYDRLTLLGFEAARYDLYDRFRVYPYLSLVDETKEFAFDKSLHLAIYYDGYRRALLNSKELISYAYQVLKGYGLPNVDANHVRYYIDNEMLDYNYQLIRSGCLDDQAIQRDNEILFLGRGYYSIALLYNDLPSNFMLNLEEYDLTDLTVEIGFNTHAKTIAEIDNDEMLFDINYTYPNRDFVSKIVINVVKPRDNYQSEIEPKEVYMINLTINKPEDSISLYDYLYNRYYMDINAKYGNEHIASNLRDRIFCLEHAYINYNDINAIAFDTDRLSAYFTISSLYFPLESMEDIYNTDDIYAIPLHYALMANTPINLCISITTTNGYDAKINCYMLPAFNQYQEYTYYANFGFYNLTNRYVKSYGNTSLDVEMPHYFYYRYFYVNGKEYGCLIGCSIDISRYQDDAIRVIAYSDWGIGYAYFAYETSNTPYDYSSGISVFMIFFISSMIAIALWQMLRRYGALD